MSISFSLSTSSQRKWSLCFATRRRCILQPLFCIFYITLRLLNWILLRGHYFWLKFTSRTAECSRKKGNWRVLFKFMGKPNANCCFYSACIKFCVEMCALNEKTCVQIFNTEYWIPSTVLFEIFCMQWP